MATFNGTEDNDTINEAEAWWAKEDEGSEINALGGDDLIIALRKNVPAPPEQGEGGGGVIGPPSTITDTIDGGTGDDVYRVVADNLWSATLDAYRETQANGTWEANLNSIESLHIIAMTHGRAALGNGDDIVDTRNAEGSSPNYDLGGGNDTFFASRGTVPVEMGAGSDRLVLDQSYNNARTYLSVALSGDYAAGYSGTYRRSDGASSFADISFSGVEHFTITTGGGTDTIVTGDGDDIVSTGGGNDLIAVARGANVVDGGSEVDALSVDLSEESAGVTIDLLLSGAQQTGGDGSVTAVESFAGAVVGSAHDDVFREGNHAFAATFETGAGDDLVQLSRGIDIVNMGAGSDRLVVDYSHSNGHFYGEDEPFIGTFADGYSGQVYLGGGSAQATFSGVEHFTITSAGGNDAVVVGGGDDVVSTGLGSDQVTAGQGSDTLDGGDGIDRLGADYSGRTAAIAVDLLAAGAQQSGGAGSVTNFESFEGAVIGTAFNDLFREGAFGFGAIFSTGAGNDVVQVSSGIDTVDMGAGSDRLVVDYSHSNGRFYGENEPFTGTLVTGYSGQVYLGGGSAETTFSGVEHFTITSGGGGDTVVVGDGDDVVATGAGSDRVTAGRGVNQLDGGGDVDRLSADFTGRASGVSVNLLIAGAQQATGPGSVANFESFEGAVTGTGFNDVFREGVHGYDALFSTGAGSDLVQVSSGDDIVNMGGGGGDRLVVDYSHSNGRFYGETEPFTGSLATGYSGQFYLGGGSAETTFSGVEHFTISTGGSGDTIEVGDGNDVISSGLGIDIIRSAGGNDTINAGEGADTIDGGAGSDRMSGGAGDDLYVVDHGGDRIFETATGGVDRVTSAVSVTLAAYVEKLTLTGAGAVNGTGNRGNNELTGNTAANILDGGYGQDKITGGGGDDAYIVDNRFDSIVEAASAGTDRVLSSATYTLSDNVEQLTLTGAAAINGSGNEAANRLFGNVAANILNGGAAGDYMAGGGGNDIYYVDDRLDRVVEGASAGVDTVRSTGTFTLGANIEDLMLIGSAVTNGVGNSLANSLAGNTAGNALDGGAGNDRLSGGGGADRFVFNSALNPTANVDDILDFSTADDTIVLDRTIFSGLAATGVLKEGAFVAGTKAGDADDRIVYDAGTGRIFYDADGAGSGAAVLFARVDPGTALTSADFLAVA